MVVLFPLKVQCVLSKCLHCEEDGDVPAGHDTGSETPVTNTERLKIWVRDRYVIQASAFTAAAVLYCKGKRFSTHKETADVGCHTLRLRCSWHWQSWL